MDHIIFINYISMDQPINKIPATFSKRFLTQNGSPLRHATRQDDTVHHTAPVDAKPHQTAQAQILPKRTQKQSSIG